MQLQYSTVMQIMHDCFTANSTEIVTFIAVIAFKLLSRKVLFINRKGNRTF